LIVTPLVNPSALAFDKPISPENVINPVAWSTLKNLPTLKNPNWSVLTKNTLPFRLSQTWALEAVLSVV